MDRLISATKLLKKKTTIFVPADSDTTFDTDWSSEVVFVEDIKNAPTVDAKPVVHGRWLERGSPWTTLWNCSVCGKSPQISSQETDYCPHCGAEME